MSGHGDWEAAKAESPRESSRVDPPIEEPANSLRSQTVVSIVTIVVAALIVLVPVWRLAAFRVPHDGAKFAQGSAGFAWRSHHGLQFILTISRDSVLTVGDPRSPAARAGLRSGDHLVSIDRIALADSAELSRLYARLRGGDTLVYRVRRGTATMEFPVRQERTWDALARDPLFWVDFPVALAFLAVGIFVIRVRWGQRRARVFGLLCLVAAVYFLLGWLFVGTPGISPLGSTDLMRLVLLVASAYVALGLCLPVLLLHLALIFPRERPALLAHPHLLAWLYVGAMTPLVAYAMAAVSYVTAWPLLTEASVVLAILVLVAVLILLRPNGRRLKTRIASRPVEAGVAISCFNLLILALCTSEPLLRHAGRHALLVSAVPLLLLPITILVLVSGYLTATTVALVRSYRECRGEERAQLRWPLWGTTTAVLIGAAAVLVNLLEETKWQWLRSLTSFLPPVTPRVMEVLFPVASLLIPVGFAVGILKYRLMDIEIVIRRTALYALVSVMLAVIYLGLTGGLGGWVVKALGLKSHWVAAFSTVTVVAVFVPVRNRVQSLLDRHFFRTRYDAAESLQRLAQELARTGDRRKLLQLVADETQGTLETRNSTVFLVSGKPPCLAVEAKVGLPDDRLKELRLILDHRTVESLNRGTMLRCEDLSGAAAAFARRAEVTVLVPVKRQQRLLGAIGLGAKLSDEAFEETDKQYLGAVAGQLASSLADLDATSRQREMDDAREIQAGLLPSSLPSLPGIRLAANWRPARMVAGDYYDLLALGDELAALCIADVSGKGMPAALLMSNLQATVRAFATADLPPRQLCERVNRVMSANIAPGRFITFFYGLLDAGKRTLTFTNAGHNPPILLHSDGTVCWLDAGGLLLGVLPEATYEQATVKLQSGDRVLIYTDGVTEAGGAVGNMFGEDRLIEALRSTASDPQDMQRAVLEAAAAFCGEEFEDDATVIAAVVE